MLQHLSWGCPAQQPLPAEDVLLVAGLLPQPGCYHARSHSTSVSELGWSQAIMMQENAEHEAGEDHLPAFPGALHSSPTALKKLLPCHQLK